MISRRALKRLAISVLVIGVTILLSPWDITAEPQIDYRWLDIADQAYNPTYRASYTYDLAEVNLSYNVHDLLFCGVLNGLGLKPNFAYQLKLVGNPGTDDNERIGLAGRWWQEEWDGTAWVNGTNLNNKGDGSSPNPNDEVYFSNKDIPHSTSPTGYLYKYTGYLLFDYIVTDEDGEIDHSFCVDSSYHVIWKTSQRTWTPDDGGILPTTFDADDSSAYLDSGGNDFPLQTVEIFGEWERLPVGGITLAPGDYQVQFVLTEESFHGSGGAYAGSWAEAVSQQVVFTIAERVTATLKLSPGWNMITLPIMPEQSYTAQSLIDAVNSGQGQACSEIYRWLDGSWEGYWIGGGTDDFAINPGEGYSLKCSDRTDWTIEGMAFWEEVDHALAAGWNLVGVPYQSQPYDAQALIEMYNLEGITCSEVNRWENSGWDAYQDGLPFNSFPIEPDQGYFIYCSTTSD